jgi:hypothetical protein
MVRETKPDLLIIGSYDPIMRYSNKILSGLGVLPYIMCSAVRPDAAIISLHYNMYPKEFFEKLSLYCNYHLGCEAKYFNLSNVTSSQNAGDNNKLDYLTIQSSFVMQNIQQKMNYDDIAIFTELLEDSVTQTYTTLERELTGNIQNIK